MKKHRVVFNGINYRVQWLGKTLILRRPKWYWMYQQGLYDTSIAEFITKDEATSAMHKFELAIDAEKRGYQPI